jgi:glycosyltransferase involved in cell wall biosynthesis
MTPASTIHNGHHGHKLIFYAPADVQVARVDRQCIVYACEAWQRIGIDVELVAMKIRLANCELRSDNPLQLYRLKSAPRLRMVRCLAGQDSVGWWSSFNRFVVHGLAALRYRKDTETRSNLVFYTKNYSSAFLFQLMRRAFPRTLKIIFEAHTLPRNAYQSSILKNTDGIIANSFALAEDLKPLINGTPIVGTHQGVDLEVYDGLRVSQKEARQKASLPTDSRLVVYTGKVYWGYREVELLLDAAPHLNPGTDLVIVGGRADHVDKYKRHIRERGLRNVRFTGFVPPSEVQYYQLAADALVSYYPSGMELNRYRSPGKLFEYMASGRPIITANYSSLREVLGQDDAAAVFVPPDKPNDLALAINQLLGDQSKMAGLAETARKRVQQFTWETRARKIVQFIESLN